MRVDDTGIEECAFEATYPETIGSNIQPCISLIAEAPERTSPVIGCSGGSMHTSWHTSDIKFAVKSPT